jgi:hypothetical protein
MACAFHHSVVTHSIAEQIRKMLTLYPETGKSKYNKNANPEPISFYQIIGDYVHLPFLFAASLFQCFPNISNPFPVFNLSFTGSLLPRQQPIAVEALQHLDTYGTTTLGLYPGFGKTILGAYLAVQKHLLTVVLVHREILTTQWKKTFTDVTNARVWIVGEPNPPQICDVIICMDSRWDKIPTTFRDAVGFLIIDEMHAFCTPTRVSCLLAFHPKYVVLESGSMLRDDGLHSMAYAIAGTHGIYRESSKPFTVMKINTHTVPERKLNRIGGIEYASLVQSSLFNERRNTIILSLVTANLNFKILILTSMVEHATLLHSALEGMGVTSDYLCGTKRGYKDSNVLVGTTSKIGTGFDPATSCPTYAGRPFDLLIMVCSMKKYSMIVQNVGRVFRAEFPTVMHLVDDDNIFKSHWYKARTWYLTHGGTITDHHIANTETKTVKETDTVAKHNAWIDSKRPKN